MSMGLKQVISFCTCLNSGCTLQASWMLHRAQPAHSGHLDETDHQPVCQLGHLETRDTRRVRNEREKIVENLPGRVNPGRARRDPKEDVSPDIERFCFKPHITALLLE